MLQQQELVIERVLLLSRPLLSYVLAATLIGAFSSGVCGQDENDRGLELGNVRAVTQIPARPGCWWAMPVSVVNHSDQKQTGTIVATVDGHPSAEYSATVTVEPSARQLVDVMVEIPASASPGAVLIMGVGLIQEQAGRDVYLTNSFAPVVQDVLVHVTAEPVVTMLLADDAPATPTDWAWRAYPVDETYELAVAARFSDGLSRMMTIVEWEALPSDVRVWEAVDNVLVNHDRWLNDVSVLPAFRHWLSEGGRAWIALDRVDVQSVERLIGDLWQAQLVDEVELNSFRLSTSMLPDLASKPVQIERDRPVRFVRLVQFGGEVTHEVDGWPAAIRIPVGQGEVWLTTLGAGGWLRMVDESTGATRIPRPALEPWTMPIVGGVFQPRLPYQFDFLNATEAATFVGYQIPSRLVILLSLAASMLLTLAVGVWLARQGRAEHLGWVAPLIMLFGSLPILGVATTARRDVEDTIGRLQVAQLQPAAGHAIVHEHAAVYLSSSQPIRVDTSYGVHMEPFPQDRAKPNHRLGRISEDQTLELNVPAWPTGLHSVVSRFEHPISTIEAIGSFDERGLTVRFQPRLAMPAKDLLLATGRTRAALLKAVGENAFLLPSERDRGAPIANAVDGGLVSREQRRHRDVFQQLLADPQFDRVLLRPSVFFWSSAWQSPLTHDHDFKIGGDALNQVRLRYEIPPAKTSIAIPSEVLVPIVPPSFANDPTVMQIVADQQHIPSILAKRWQLEYQLPEELLPLAIDAAEFSVNINADARTVTLASVRDDQRQPWETVTDADGRVSLALTGDDLLVDPWRGRIRIEFVVGEPVMPEPEATDEQGSAEPAADVNDDDRGDREGNGDEGLPELAEPPPAIPTWQIDRPRLRITGIVGDRTIP